MTVRRRTNFLTKLNRHYPWLKLVVFCAIILITAISATLAHLGAQPKNQANVQNSDTSLKITLGGEETTITGLSQAIAAANQQADQARAAQLKDKKLIALTFDDGPDAENTVKILDILREKNAKATFFMVGIMIQRTPETARLVADRGHEVETHSMAHKILTEMSEPEISQDLAEAKALTKSATGVEPQILRPPYGFVDDAVKNATKLPLITWSVDPSDWQDHDPASVAKKVVSAAYEGAIVLLHDIYPSTADALPAIIDRLREQGYEFATIREMATLRGVDLTPGAVFRDL